ASPADDTRFNEHLEPAMADLGDEDRDALVLRYFEDRSLREVGTELGISEDAARMRVNRALERLRTEFGRRGTTVTVGALAAALGASTSAIPVGLSSVIAGTALATLGGSITASLGGTAAALGRVLQFSAAKVALGLTVSALVGAGVYLLLRPGNDATKPATAP